MNIFESKFFRKSVGIISIVSAILWICLSVAVVFTSFTVIDAVVKSTVAQRNETQKNFENIQDPAILDIPLPTPQVWQDTIGGLKNQTVGLFDGAIVILNFIKIGSLVIPLMIILSQVMPAVLGLMLLFD